MCSPRYARAVPFEFLFDAPRSSHAVVIHNDDRTVWAYLHTPEGVASDVWLFNLQEAPTGIAIDRERDRPPLNPARYCSGEAHPIIRFADDVSLRWLYDDADLAAVEIIAGGERLARLVPGAKLGWSRFAAMDGPCALRLT
jgi:hypothetical protein